MSKDHNKPDRAAIEKEIRDIASVTKKNIYRLGELWIQILDHELWKDAGCHSPQEYLAQKFQGADLTVKAMSTHAAIVRDFLPADLNDAGEYKLTLLQTYAHLMSINQLEGPAQIPVLVPINGKVVSKPFSECSEAELHAAIKHAGGGDDVQPLPQEKQKKLEAMRSSLDGLTRVPIHVTGEMVGDTLGLTFGNVMEDELAPFLHALSGFTTSTHKPKNASR